MSKTMPIKTKKNKKSNINYSKIAKELKGKTGFNIDLRKNNNTLNFGEKMALLKAGREYAEYKNSSNYLPITRQHNESKTAYKQRLTQTKKDYGQTGNHFKGVFTDSPDFVKTKQRRIKRGGKWTTELENNVKGKMVELEVGRGREDTKELYIPINGKEFSELDAIKYIARLWKQYPDAHFIMPMHSGHRGTGGGGHKDDIKRLGKKINQWAFAYNSEPAPQKKNESNGEYKARLKAETKKRDHWLSGFLIVWKIIVPNKGAYGKRIK